MTGGAFKISQVLGEEMSELLSGKKAQEMEDMERLQTEQASFWV